MIFPGFLQAIPSITGSVNIVALTFYLGGQPEAQGRLIIYDEDG